MDEPFKAGNTERDARPFKSLEDWGEAGEPTRLGPWELEENLGAGGFGAVYRARHRHLGKVSAIKILWPQLGQEKLNVSTFLNEARTLMDFEKHDRIVTVRDADRQGGFCYLVMDLADGFEVKGFDVGGNRVRSVAQWQAYLYLDGDRRLPEGDVLQIGLDVLEALSTAHAKQIVHRDVKPGNILLNAQGRALLGDFGLAKVMRGKVDEMRDGKSSISPKSRSGQAIMGTLGYMSPEQKQGKPIDARSDLYSLGVVLYELLTGVIPDGEVEYPHEMGLSCGEWWDDCLRKARKHFPAARWQSAGEMRSVLLKGKKEYEVRKAAEDAENERLAKIAEKERREEEDRKAHEDKVKRIRMQRENDARLKREKRELELAKKADIKRKNKLSRARKKAEADERKRGRRESEKIEEHSAPTGEKGTTISKKKSLWFLSIGGGLLSLLFVFLILPHGEKPISSDLDTRIIPTINILESDYKLKKPFSRELIEQINIPLLKEAAEKGNARAQFFLGRLYDPGLGVFNNPEKSLQWYRKSAEGGDPDGQNNYGARFAGGELLKIDYTEAAKWYRLADEQGHAVAAHNLGKLYENGQIEVSDNLEKACEMYEKSASRGLLDGMTSLAYMLYNGRGIDPDLPRAVKLFQSASDLGSSKAKEWLGYIYYTGETELGLDKKKAFDFYMDAANAGWFFSQLEIGRMLLEGNVVPQNIPESKRWLQKVVEFEGEFEGERKAERKKYAEKLLKEISFMGQHAGEERDFEIAPGVEMTMCWIPAGSFQMGSESGYDNEKPVHEVTISKGFWLGKYEVTQGQWEVVMGTSVQQQLDKADYGSKLYGEGENYPMYYVSWEESSAFAKKLREVGEAEWSWRLPSEAEWEYGCRAGSESRWSFGDEESELGEYAWYSENSGKGLHEVGEKKGNRWGLHDMHGNVWEWTGDRYGEYPKGLVRDPRGSSGVQRLYRGGSCINTAALCRSTNRHRYAPSFRTYLIGFRLTLHSQDSVTEDSEAQPTSTSESGFEGKNISSVVFRFEGEKNVDEERLFKVIKTSAGLPYKSDNIDDDIKSLYESGLFTDVRALAEPLGDSIAVIYAVTTHPSIAGVGFVGNNFFDDVKLATSLKLKSGVPTHNEMLNAALQNIEKLYTDAGYPNVVVSHRFQDSGTDQGRVLIFVITEGAKNEDQSENE